MLVVAYYAGGIPDMVAHGETGFLYRFEEVEMPTMHIRSIFSMKTLLTNCPQMGLW